MRRGIAEAEVGHDEVSGRKAEISLPAYFAKPS